MPDTSTVEKRALARLSIASAPFLRAAAGLPETISDATPIARINADATHPGTVTMITAGDLRRLSRVLAALRAADPAGSGEERLPDVPQALVCVLQVLAATSGSLTAQDVGRALGYGFPACVEAARPRLECLCTRGLATRKTVPQYGHGGGKRVHYSATDTGRATIRALPLSDPPSDPESRAGGGEP